MAGRRKPNYLKPTPQPERDENSDVESQPGRFLHIILLGLFTDQMPTIYINHAYKLISIVVLLTITYFRHGVCGHSSK